MEERIAVLEAELARVQGQVSALRRRRRHWAGWRVLLAGCLLVALISAPLGVLSANFQDLNPGSPHNANINAIADAGISRGCGSTATYCPNNLVTREEMASFLARTAGLGGNPPIANAAFALNAANAQTATLASGALLAGNSDLLNGWASHELVRSADAGNSTNFFTLTGTYGTLVVASISVPDSGFVIVSGTVRLTAGTNSLGRICARLVDPSLAIQSLEQCVAIGTVAGSLIEGQLAVHVRFPVVGTGLRNYHLQVAKDSSVSVGATAADNPSMSVAYVPFGAGGAQAAATVELADSEAVIIPLRDIPPSNDAPYQVP